VIGRVAVCSVIVAIAVSQVAERRPAHLASLATLDTRSDPTSVVEVAAQTAAAPTTAPTTAPRPSPPRFTIAVTGDILLHMPVTDRAARYAADLGTGARDFRPMFGRIRTLIDGADLALCHLETPLSPDGFGLRGNPTFSSAPEIAPAIASAGFDGCSTASNHSFDTGDTGILATLDHLDMAGIGHDGTARTQADDETPQLYGVGGFTVAHLSYTSFLNASHPDEPWMINLATRDRAAEIAADAVRARAAGADFVIVSVHWGNEFVRAPSGTQVELADAITAIPEVDVVVGHHAHVVQPIAMYHDKYVVFGLGNFLSNQHAATCCPIESQDGVVVRLTVEARATRLEVVAVDFTPTRVDLDSYEIVPVTLAALDPTISESERDELLRSRERTAAAVRSSGLLIDESPAQAVLGELGVSRPSRGG
jgi:poly-gamma-glutamate synthesis protein (capsule biosynthesis protein)